MRALFVSFSTLVCRLSRKTVSDEELLTGLFYMGCVREHALNPWTKELNEMEIYFKDDDDGAHAAHRQILAAIKKAEDEGRIRWRDRGAQNTYAELDDLLKQNGFPSFCGSEVDEVELSYFYPRVRKLIEEANIPLEVVC